MPIVASLQVTSPAGNVVHTQKGTSGDKFELKAPRSGMYKFCFHNPYSAPETVSFYIHVGHIPSEHNIAKDGLCMFMSIIHSFPQYICCSILYLCQYFMLLYVVVVLLCRALGPNQCQNCRAQRSTGVCNCRAEVFKSA